MLFSKKAQAAMEFLMTYGWAILVVLIVVGALAYFGVLNPSNLIPERCVFPTMLTCSDYVITTGEIGLKFINGAGQDMTIYTVNYTTTDTTIITTNCNYNNPIGMSVPQGSTANFTTGIQGASATACTGKWGASCSPNCGKKKFNVEVTYSTGTSGLVHKLNGELFASRTS